MALQVKPSPGKNYVIRGNIVVNCLQITGLITVPYYQYDVGKKDSLGTVALPLHAICDKEFGDNVGERGRTQLIDALQKQEIIFTPRASYDRNKSLFSPHKLSFKHGLDFQEFVVKLGSKGHPVVLKYAREILPSDLQLLQTRPEQQERNLRLSSINLLNVLVRAAPSEQARVTTKGRGFYLEQGYQTPSTQVVEFWKGFFQSVRPSPKGLILNLDTTSALMYPRGGLLDALMALVGVTDTRDLERRCAESGSGLRYRKQITRYVKGLRVRFEHRSNAPAKAITGMEWISPSEYTFEMEGQMISVEDYMFQRYRKGPRRGSWFPALACFGKENRVPLELLTIEPGQPFRAAIPESVQSAFLSFTQQKPRERLLKLQEAAKEDYYQNSKYLKDAGVNISQNFMQVNARVIKSPVIKVQESGIVVNPETGSWNMLGKRVEVAGKIEDIIVVNTSGNWAKSGERDGPSTCRGVVDKLLNTLSQMGIGRCYLGRKGRNLLYLLAPRNRHYLDYSGQALNVRLDEFTLDLYNKRLIGPTETTMVIVVVQESQRTVRECVKWWGDVKRGVMTQVLRSSKLKKTSGNQFDQYARNVGLKINAKMGGLNFIPKNIPVDRLKGVNTMIVGIDTSHPRDLTYPTTAALVYSVDQCWCNYHAVVKFQQPRQEIVDDLENMMVDALKSYYQSRGTPRMVIIYRDGVSEGQFDQVVNDEITKIKSAFEKHLAATYPGRRLPLPQLTFIIVGKRHHIRMLPGDKHMVDVRGNALPGTVVDRDITTTEPGVFDFYLQSHGSILGTSRPAHYSVIYDDFEFNADELQALSYTLCHSYQIATRSVSIPAPVYYADQVAGRSAFQLYKVNNDNASMFSDDLNYEWWVKQLKERRQDTQLHRITLGRMYWL